MSIEDLLQALDEYNRREGATAKLVLYGDGSGLIQRGTEVIGIFERVEDAVEMLQARETV